jgi:hypothetical protein
VDAAVAAAARQPAGTLMLRPDRLTPAELADEVLAATANPDPFIDPTTWLAPRTPKNCRLRVAGGKPRLSGNPRARTRRRRCKTIPRPQSDEGEQRPGFPRGPASASTPLVGRGSSRHRTSLGDTMIADEISRRVEAGQTQSGTQRARDDSGSS